MTIKYAEGFESVKISADINAKSAWEQRGMTPASIVPPNVVDGIGVSTKMSRYENGHCLYSPIAVGTKMDYVDYVGVKLGDNPALSCMVKPLSSVDLEGLDGYITSTSDVPALPTYVDPGDGETYLIGVTIAGTTVTGPGRGIYRIGAEFTDYTFIGELPTPLSSSARRRVGANVIFLPEANQYVLFSSENRNSDGVSSLQPMRALICTKSFKTAGPGNLITAADWNDNESISIATGLPWSALQNNGIGNMPGVVSSDGKKLWMCLRYVNTIVNAVGIVGLYDSETSTLTRITTNAINEQIVFMRRLTDTTILCLSNRGSHFILDETNSSLTKTAGTEKSTQAMVFQHVEDDTIIGMDRRGTIYVSNDNMLTASVININGLVSDDSTQHPILTKYQSTVVAMTTVGTTVAISSDNGLTWNTTISKAITPSKLVETKGRIAVVVPNSIGVYDDYYSIEWLPSVRMVENLSGQLGFVLDVNQSNLIQSCISNDQRTGLRTEIRNMAAAIDSVNITATAETGKILNNWGNFELTTATTVPNTFKLTMWYNGVPMVDTDFTFEAIPYNYIAAAQQVVRPALGASASKTASLGNVYVQALSTSILRTDDYGKTWNLIDLNRPDTTVNQVVTHKGKFVCSSTNPTTGAGNILVSADGANWSVLSNVPAAAAMQNQFLCSTSDVLYLTAGDKQVYGSIDGGLNWKLVFEMPSTYNQGIVVGLGANDNGFVVRINKNVTQAGPIFVGSYDVPQIELMDIPGTLVTGGVFGLTEFFVRGDTLITTMMIQGRDQVCSVFITIPEDVTTSSVEIFEHGSTSQTYLSTGNYVTTDVFEHNGRYFFSMASRTTATMILSELTPDLKDSAVITPGPQVRAPFIFPDGTMWASQYNLSSPMRKRYQSPKDIEVLVRIPFAGPIAVDDIVITDSISPNAGPQGECRIVRHVLDQDIKAEWLRVPTSLPSNAIATQTFSANDKRTRVESNEPGQEDEYKSTTAPSIPAGLKPIAVSSEAYFSRMFTNTPIVKHGIGVGDDYVDNTQALTTTRTYPTRSSIILDSQPDDSSWTAASLANIQTKIQKVE